MTRSFLLVERFVILNPRRAVPVTRHSAEVLGAPAAATLPRLSIR